MARTPEIEISVDPIHPQPEWMSDADYCMLLDRFGMEVSRVTCYTYFPENSIHPSDLAYQCMVAWDERWTTRYDNWLYYGSYPDDDFVDESEWRREVAMYRGEDEPADEDSMYNREWQKRCEFNRKIELALPDMWSHEFIRQPRKRRHGSTAKQLRRDGHAKWSRADRKSNYDQEGKRGAERRGAKYDRSGSAQPVTPNPWAWTPNRGGSGAYRTESRPRIKWTMSAGCVDRSEFVSDGSWMPRVGSRR